MKWQEKELNEFYALEVGNGATRGWHDTFTTLEAAKEAAEQLGVEARITTTPVKEWVYIP